VSSGSQYSLVLYALDAYVHNVRTSCVVISIDLCLKRPDLRKFIVSISK